MDDPVEALGLELAGETSFAVDVCVYKSFDGRVYQPVLRQDSRLCSIVLLAGRPLMLVPCSVYEKGDIAESWCFAGEDKKLLAKAGVNQTEQLLKMRDGRWIFLMKRLSGKKWPARLAADVIREVVDEIKQHDSGSTP